MRRFALPWVLLGVLLGVLLAAAACGTPRTGFVAQAPAPALPKGTVEVHGFGPDMLERIDVALARSGDEPSAAILGETRLEDGAIVFEPRFPFERGVAYCVRVDGEPRWPFEFPERERPRSTEVTAVTPSADELPSNLLKFYLHFSAPMRRGAAARHVRLLEADGTVVEDAFLELASELWDPERTRLTLFLQPGRIKRGLVPHRELGPVLEPGREYALEIDAAWPDANRAPLRAGLRKTFRATEPDRSSPDPNRWKITPPVAGEHGTLHVDLDEPLDHGLLERVLTVRDPEGRTLPGEVRIREHETRWSFVPDEPWRTGVHQLRVEAVLEDLAGNSVGRPFEEPPPTERQAATEAVVLPFEISDRFSYTGRELDGALFGHSVAGLGDLDGDGWDDFAVGAPMAWSERGRTGAVLVFSGRNFEVLYRLAGARNGSGYGDRLRALGDLDGDGHEELAVCRLYLSGVEVVSGRSGERLFAFDGTDCLGPVGDVDGDGLPELAFVRGWHPTSRVAIRSSTTGRALWSRSFEPFRHAGVAEDLDADGIRELVLSPRRYSETSTEPSKRFTVVSGRDGSPATGELPWPSRESSPPRPQIVSTSADVDGDGSRELVFNASDLERGQVQLFVVEGRAHRTLRLWRYDPAETVDVIDYLTLQLLCPGDFDRDGSEDLLVAHQSFMNTRVRLVSGRSGAALWESEDLVNNEQSYAVVGDRNGDRTPEILVGSALHMRGFGPPQYGTIHDPWAGFVQILSGSDGSILHELSERDFSERLLTRR